MGVVVGVAVIVTMVSFGLGLQRNTVARFNELDSLMKSRSRAKSLEHRRLRPRWRRPAEAAKSRAREVRRKFFARTLE